jgi:hypothetical protein
MIIGFEEGFKRSRFWEHPAPWINVIGHVRRVGTF